jgi:hypothetical protein
MIILFFKNNRNKHESLLLPLPLDSLFAWWRLGELTLANVIKQSAVTLLIWIQSLVFFL